MEFIKAYIQGSRKSYLFVTNSLCAMGADAEQSKRLCHIVSSFFLGLVIYYNHRFIKSKIIEELKNLQVFKDYDDLDKQFVFVWFMTCMFHDIGYVFEKNIVNIHVTQHELISEKEKLIKTLNSLQKEGLPGHYKDIVDNYLRYRENKDHGILGGLSYAENVCKIRKEQYEKAKKDKNEKEMNQWNENLNRLYQYVAWRICCHNIFYIRVGDSSCTDVLQYIYYGLYPLMLCNRKKKDGIYVDYPISFDKSPLFFFFCLIDSIDPMKLCDKIPEDLEFGYEDNGVIISCTNAQYIQKVEKINDWLIGVKKEDNKITFHLTEGCLS